MRHNKILSAAIALCMVAFFTIGAVPSASASPPTPVPVTITAVYDLSTFPNVTGTFTTSGALARSEEHTSELQSQSNLVCRLLLEKKKKNTTSSSAQVQFYYLNTCLSPY